MEKIFETGKGNITLLEKDKTIEISFDDGSYIKISDVKVPLLTFENKIKTCIEEVKKTWKKQCRNYI